MALPKLSDVGRDHTITLDDDLTVTFQLRPIPGSRYQSIIDAHRDDEGRASHEAVAVDMLTAGISAVYSSVESTPTPFAETDAVELWEQWPEWARTQVYSAVIAYSTRGPAADPFDKSKPKGNDAS